MGQETTRNTVISILTSGYKINDELSSLFKKFDLSLPQFNVLRILRGQRGKPANLSTVQERMIHKMSNTTRLIDKLIQKGFVKRNICENNRRKIEIYITNSGLELLKSIDETLNNKESFILENINLEEKKELLRILSKIKTT
ncbi:MAG: MarR family transcriptional regulator [Flavobacteriales bacterium]|nr:MarR family transcriptional regulator [Candidatus Arcticimaribacter sp.]